MVPAHEHLAVDLITPREKAACVPTREDRASRRHARLQHSDLPQESHLVVEEIFLDDLTVLPARNRTELQFECLSRCLMDLAVEPLPWADHLALPLCDRAGPIARTTHHAVRIVV